MDSINQPPPAQLAGVPQDGGGCSARQAGRDGGVTLPQRVHPQSLLIAIKGDPMILPGAVWLPTIDKQPLACLFHLPAILLLY